MNNSDDRNGKKRGESNPYRGERRNSGDLHSASHRQDRTGNTNEKRNFDSNRSGQSSPGNRDHQEWDRNAKRSTGSYSRRTEEGSKDRGFRKDGDSRPGYTHSEGKPFRDRSFSKSENEFSRTRRGKRPRIKRPKPDAAGPRTPKNDGTTRLNKYIAHAGICSRREADDLIKAGLVTINEQVVTEMGVKVNPGDVVKYNGEKLRSEKKVYILLNKPKDFVTTNDDPEGRKTVIDIVKKACDERVYPVGRLDRNTTGILLLTNDGGLATRLTHPKYNVKKIYQVFLEENLKIEDLNTLAEGVTLDDGFIKPDSVNIIDPEKKNEIGIEIHSGKNRIVRRMFEHLGYKVTRLDRVFFAGLTKKNLPRGKYRFLTEKEISMLKMNAFG